jgi:hypothetical protein
MLKSRHIQYGQMPKCGNVLLKPLRKFFSIESNFNRFQSLVMSKKTTSLRIIDWFVTNWCKSNNTYFKTHTGNGDIFIVYLEYKSQLRSYSKRKFDPFCRRGRIEIELCGHSVVTTIGQLNFFKWFIENKIDDFMELQSEKIQHSPWLNDKSSSYCKTYSGPITLNFQ